MSIKKILGGLFKPKDSKKIQSDDSFCYSKIIWNTRNNFVVLLSFTEDYFASIIELQDAMLQRFWNFNSKVVFSSFDEETDKVDEDGNKIWLIHNRYYMLIGGESIYWKELYTKIHNLGNEALARITDEIVNNCYARDFEDLINDGILYGFKYTESMPKYDYPLEINNHIEYTDPKALLQRLPSGFTARDIMPFITIVYPYGAKILNSYLELVNVQHMSEKYFQEQYSLKCVYTDLFGEDITVEKLVTYLQPLYKQPDDDTLPGDVDDESLDSIFKENYDRFSAVRDDNTYYEDIDEELEDDEETENMKQEDIVE